MFEEYLFSHTEQNTIHTSKNLWRDIGINDAPTDEPEEDNVVSSITSNSHPGDIAQLLETDLAVQLSLLQDYSTCLFCNAKYIKIKNIGTYNCSFHPDPGSDPGRYNCCKISKSDESPRGRGCRSCDHTPNTKYDAHDERWSDANYYFRVPLYLAAHFQLDRSTKKIVKNHEEPCKSYIVVSRIKDLPLPNE